MMPAKHVRMAPTSYAQSEETSTAVMTSTSTTLGDEGYDMATELSCFSLEHLVQT